MFLIQGTQYEGLYIKQCIYFTLAKKKKFLCISRAFSDHLQNYCNSLTETRDRKRTSWVLCTISLWLETNLITGLGPYLSCTLQ